MKFIINRILYNLMILLSASIIFVPIGLCAAYAFTENILFIYVAAVAGAFGLVLTPFAKRLRTYFRKATEYDSFGFSKSKGRYDNLSRKERDAIDLNKAMDNERILSSSDLRRITHKGSKYPERDMNNLIGLNCVKRKMEELSARMEFEKDMKKKRKKEEHLENHFVFYGSPGTGKTTVARIMTGFLYKNGMIRENKCVEIDGNFLCSGSVSDASTRVRLVVNAAYGGVLFIDEAYALNMNTAGESVVSSLLKIMEDERGSFILIIAGYTNEVNRLLDSNPGFKSRFSDSLLFEDYSIEELYQIFELMADEQGYVIECGCRLYFENLMEHEMESLYFGNARTVRKTLENSITLHALNWKKGLHSRLEKYVITSLDMSE